MDVDELTDLKSDDRLKIKAIYNRYRGEFIGFGKRYNLDQDRLADAYQDAFLALRKQAVRGRLDTVESSMKTYLFGIGKFKIFDELKAHKKEVAYEPQMHVVGHEVEEIEINPEPQLTEKQEVLRKYLKELGGKCREVLTMFYYRGLNIKEIAELGGYRNENTVKAQKSRCLKTLRQLCNPKSP